MSSQVVTGVPLTARIRSPFCRPRGLRRAGRVTGRAGAGDVDRHDAVGERDHRRLLAGLGVVGRVGRVGQAHEDRGEVEGDDREREVGGRAGAHHDRALPHRVAPHRPGLVLRRDVVVLRRHADDLAEAAERDALDAVLGLAALERPDGRSEADEVAADLHAEGLGGQHVTRLMQADRDQDSQSEQDDPEDLHPEALSFPYAAATIARARSRAHRSAASTSSTVPGSSKSGASVSTRATVSTMPRNGSRPCVKAATHSSLAAL